MVADKKAAVTDYIPLTANVISGLDLSKSSMIDSHKDEDFHHVPLTPSPEIRDPSETEYGELSGEKTVLDEAILYYPPPYSATAPYITSQPGYYTPPTPFPTPTTSQAFHFDPLYLPQIYSYPSVVPTTPYNVPQPEAQYVNPSKRRRVSRGSKKSSEEECKSNIYANSVAAMKSTFIDYHNAATVEIFKGCTESQSKHKQCQTTFRQPHQMSSIEDFTSLAVLLQIFSKQATVESGKRYGVRSDTT